MLAGAFYDYLIVGHVYPGKVNISANIAQSRDNMKGLQKYASGDKAAVDTESR
jgi:hypothetical protein